MKPHQFIKFDGIDGESMDEDFTGYIDVLEFTFGADIPADTGWGGTGRTYGRGRPNNFTFKKFLDRATPAIYYSTLVGRHFPKVEFIATKASGAEVLRYYSMVFTGVNVKNVLTEGQYGSGAPLESVEIVFEELEMIYHLQAVHGSGDVEPRLLWNNKTQKGSVM